jgi:hypothetical protein
MVGGMRGQVNEGLGVDATSKWLLVKNPHFTHQVVLSVKACSRQLSLSL